MNPSSLSPRSFSPALVRRITLAQRQRPSPPSPSTSLRRYVQTFTPLRPSTIPPPTALSALLSRLSLPANAALHPALVACLTHPSFAPQVEELVVVHEGSASSPSSEGSSSLTSEVEGENNEILSALGNSLLGLFASEHLASLYPLLPTSALQSAITAYVGPSSCSSVARELGVSVQGGGNAGLPGQGRGSHSAGVAVRWSRTALTEKYWEEKKGKLTGPETVPVARRFKKYLDKGKLAEAGQAEAGVEQPEGGERRTKRDTFENVVADTVRAFVGLIYQEQGIHAARTFVHAHFLSRALDLSTILTPKNPMHMLSSLVSKHLSDAGVLPSSNAGIIEKRLLASSGVATQSPLFLIGLFLPSGIKLAEGSGSSKAMAEYRAAKNALLSFFLVRGDQPGLPSSVGRARTGAGAGAGAERVLGEGQGLPTSAHGKKLLSELKVVRSEDEGEYVGIEMGGKDVVAQSRLGRRRA